MNNRTLLVAHREYKSTVMTKAFIFSAFIFPVAIWGLAIIIPQIIKTEVPQLQGTIAIVDGTGVLAKPIEHEFDPAYLKQLSEQAQKEGKAQVDKALESAGMQDNAAVRILAQRQLDKYKGQKIPAVQFTTIKPEEEHADQLREQVYNGKLLAWIHIDKSALDPLAKAPVTILTAKDMAVDNIDRLQSTVQQVVVDQRFNQQGMSVNQIRLMLIPARVVMNKATEGGVMKTNEAASFLVPMGFMMLLWISTFTGGQYLLTSTVEEKTNKIIEVVLGGTSPMELMSGKILGQCGVALTMLAVYVLLAVSGLQKTGYGDLIDYSRLSLVMPYFVMAFFFIACMMAAVGSAVNEMREAQALMAPVMMVVMLPLIAWLPIVQSPNGTFATVTSFIPPVTPFVMALRLGSDQIIPTWQIVATNIIGFAAVFVFIWMTAKIFRIGILMSGKAPNFATLFRWLRQA